MGVAVRRITGDEGPDLQRVRLAALADSPSAFGSTLDAESDRPASEWADRAGIVDRILDWYVAVADGANRIIDRGRDRVRPTVRHPPFWCSRPGGSGGGLR